MKCRIFRDFDTDNVVRVENDNGQESSLYREALSHTKDQENALDIWATGSLPAFKDYIKDKDLNVDQEPQLKDVLKFINNFNTTDKLSVQDIVEITNNLQSINVESPESLLNTLQRTFFDGSGLFNINRNKLISSNLYSSTEVNNIMSFPSVRNDIKIFINKLRNTLKEDNNLQSIFTDNTSSSDYSVQDSERTMGIGKFRNYLPEEIRDYVLDNIKSFNSDSDFKAQIQSLDNIAIRDYILDNAEVFDSIKNSVLNSKVVPVFSELDGLVVPKLKNDLVPSILNTLRVGESKIDFTNVVDQIRALDPDNWYGNTDIPKILKDVELQSAMNHIDIVGLSNEYNNKSREEIIGILDIIDDFLFKSEKNEITNSDIYDLSTDVSEFFNEDNSQDQIVIPVSENDMSRNLSFIDSNLNELELFRNEGYVKLRDNIFQKASVFNSFEDMLYETYQSLLNDISILPDNILTNLKLKTDGYYNLAYLLNPKNEQNITNKIKDLVVRDMEHPAPIENNEDFDLIKQLSLYKILLKIPTNTDNSINITEFSNRRDIIDLNEEGLDYLTSDFISDFYSRILQEKALGTEVYNNALKYFEITNKGINFTSPNTLIKNQVINILNNNDTLPLIQAYSAISKNQSLEFLIPQSDSEVLVDIQTRRDFVVNHPETVTKFKDSFLRIDPSTIVIKNSKEEFVKINGNLYELTDFRNGVSIYSALNKIEDSSYYVINVVKPIINTNVNIESFETFNQDLNLIDRSKVSTTKTNELLENLTC